MRTWKLLGRGFSHNAPSVLGARLRAIAGVALWIGVVHSPAASELDIFADTHLGAATCATSQCHGKSAPQEGRNVQLDEYTTWIEADQHSLAYQTLESDASKLIAAKMGLKNARNADICLDCHTDNAPSDKRGPKFQIGDGVGCEACHGGAERWIQTHTDPDATHARNLSQGMIATESASVRAEVCLSCHLGTKNKFATHIIMGAGHPRLTFELKLFTELQPAHYTVDEDYIERKGNIPDFNLWLTGQLESAEQTLRVAIDRMHDGVGIFPDFAFYDCQSCHHSLKDRRWSRKRADGLTAGSLRMNLPNLVIIEAATGALGESSLRDSITQARLNTLRAAQRSKQDFTQAAQAFLTQLATARDTLTSRSYTAADIRSVRRALLDSAAANLASDYAEAEQVFYSFETLCGALDEFDQCQGALDGLFAAVEDSATYSPWKFAKAAGNLAGGF